MNGIFSPKVKMARSFSGLGLGGWTYRNQTPDPTVKMFQQHINTQLKKLGYIPISEDGKLGPATCGAFSHLADKVNRDKVDWSVFAGDPIPEVNACEGWTNPTRVGTKAPEQSFTTVKPSDYALPWQEANERTATVQKQVNSFLIGQGYETIPVTGIMDGRLCGALKWLTDNTGGTWLNDYGMNCKEFIAPSKAAPPVVAQPALPPMATGPGLPITTPPPPKGKISAATMVTGGLVVAGAAGFYYYAKKKGWVA